MEYKTPKPKLGRIIKSVKLDFNTLLLYGSDVFL